MSVTSLIFPDRTFRVLRHCCFTLKPQSSFKAGRSHVRILSFEIPATRRSRRLSNKPLLTTLITYGFEVVESYLTRRNKRRVLVSKLESTCRKCFRGEKGMAGANSCALQVFGGFATVNIAMSTKTPDNVSSDQGPYTPSTSCFHVEWASCDPEIHGECIT